MGLQHTATRLLGGPVGRLRFDLLELPTNEGPMPDGVRAMSTDDLGAADGSRLLAAGVDHRERLRNGAVGLLAEDAAGQPAGVLWLSFTEHVDRYGGRWTAPTADTCYLNQLLVSPQHRRQGVAARLVTAAQVVGNDKDRSTIRVLVAPDNSASLATFRARNAYTAHHLFGLRLGSRSLTFRRPERATSR